MWPDGQETGIGQKLVFLCSSMALLLLQTMALMAVASGVSVPSCVEQPECSSGKYCSDPASPLGGGICMPCLRGSQTAGLLEANLPPAELLGTNLTDASAYCGEDEHAASNYCMGCYDPGLPGTGWNIGKSINMQFEDATRRMHGGDWCALLLVSCVVGLYCAGELRGAIGRSQFQA